MAGWLVPACAFGCVQTVASWLLPSWSLASCVCARAGSQDVAGRVLHALDHASAGGADRALLSEWRYAGTAWYLERRACMHAMAVAAPAPARQQIPAATEPESPQLFPCRRMHTRPTRPAPALDRMPMAMVAMAFQHPRAWLHLLSLCRSLAECNVTALTANHR